MLCAQWDWTRDEIQEREENKKGAGSTEKWKRSKENSLKGANRGTLKGSQEQRARGNFKRSKEHRLSLTGAHSMQNDPLKTCCWITVFTPSEVLCEVPFSTFACLLAMSFRWWIISAKGLPEMAYTCWKAPLVFCMACPCHTIESAWPSKCSRL